MRIWEGLAWSLVGCQWSAIGTSAAADADVVIVFRHTVCACNAHTESKNSKMSSQHEKRKSNRKHRIHLITINRNEIKSKTWNPLRFRSSRCKPFGNLSNWMIAVEHICMHACIAGNSVECVQIAHFSNKLLVFILVVCKCQYRLQELAKKQRQQHSATTMATVHKIQTNNKETIENSKLWNKSPDWTERSVSDGKKCAKHVKISNCRQSSNECNNNKAHRVPPIDSVDVSVLCA